MEAVAVAEALAHVPPFGLLAHVERQELAARMRLRRFGRDEVVYHRDDPATHLYVLLAGTVKVSMVDELGRETVLNVLRGGDLFGELSLFDGIPRSATVSTITDSEILLLSGEEFLTILERHPTAMREMLRMLSRNIRRLSERVEDLHLLDVPSRIAKALLDLASHAGSSREVVITQEDVAAMVGATRVSVNRVFADLEQRGLIKCGRRRVEILDADRLRREVRYQ